MTTASTTYPPFPVLIVDDEAGAIEGVELSLVANGMCHTRACQDSREVMSMLAETGASVVLLDLRMPHLDGLDLMTRIAVRYPDIPVIVVTGVNEVETAVNCMRMGAFDYMVKPVEEVRLVSGVRRALGLWEERREYRAFRQMVFDDTLHHPEAFREIVTRSKSMRAVFQYVEAIAGTGKPVLITGETGVGKELLARAVHVLSGVPGPFVPVNVAGLDEGLFSDTLFGHSAGAFTGARRSRAGLVAQAANGTLFLDEIGDLAESSQVKLLRLLQEGDYLPVGSDVPREASARIVAATNRELQPLRQGGGFRADLYYRLGNHRVHIPPLRERREDIPALVDHFLAKAAESRGVAVPVATAEFLAALAAHEFPGNVRELEAMVFDALSHSSSEGLSPGHLRIGPGQPSASSVAPDAAGGDVVSLLAGLDRLPTLREIPRLLIDEALRRAGGNQAAAARLLGITRSGLSKALKRAAARE